MGEAVSKPLAICVMGPTAAGKTAAAFALADEFPVDIISVDSAQIYRGMDIGTAKPDAATLAKYPHRLIDILDPAERYSAAQFRADALHEMHDISAAGRIPLLVGGTGLYFRALLEGLSDLPDADAATRAAIDAEAANKGWAVLHAELAEVDPETAARISPNDPQRIQRALEVHRLTGEPMSHLFSRQAEGPAPYRFVKFGIAPADRAVLHERIAQRFERMMQQGFVDEVRALHARGDLHPGLPSIRAVGYRQLWSYLEGEIDRSEAIRQGIVATRRYAKRQLTWFRKEPALTWLDASDPGHVESLVSQVKSHCE
ncbi:MAG: tRNA (adenosine(37)-N6)-dimethylallyltransferase MiaA [Gammaproteobacteria bacterium]|nr:tRNA (adenosine(37)-N6)-dimethylallyltransferase MiaA [Gammaproteobacteria bacterium]